MGIDAVAAVRIPIAALRKALERPPAGAEDEEGGDPRFEDFLGPGGMMFSVRALEDASLIYTSARFDNEPDEVALHLRQLLGQLLDQHDDERGLLLFPDVLEPSSSNWAELVDEVGEGGDWTPIVPEGYVPRRLREAPDGSMQAIMGELMGSMGAEIGQLQQALFSGDQQGLAAAAQKFEQQLATSGQQDKLQAALGDWLGGAAGSPDLAAQLEAMPGLPEDLGSMDMQALLDKAGAIAQAHPELEATLRAQMAAQAGEAATEVGAEAAEGTEAGADAGADDDPDANG